MPFVKHAGIKGRVYVPEASPAGTKKHPCPGCFWCQNCSESRCRVCRKHQENDGETPASCPSDDNHAQGAGESANGCPFRLD